MGYRDGNYIIRVTPAESERVQKAVLDGGGSWADGKKVIRHADNRYLIIESLEISRTNCMMDCNYYRIKPHMFIEGLRIERQAEKLRRSFIEPMKGAAHLGVLTRVMGPNIQALARAELARRESQETRESFLFRTDPHFYREVQDARDRERYTSGVAAEPLSADSLDTLQGLLGAGYGASTQALNDVQTDLDTDIDEKIQEALHPCILSSKPRNIFEEKKQLRKLKQGKPGSHGLKTCTKCGVRGLHWENGLYNGNLTWWLFDKKGTSHQCDPFKDTTFSTPEEQELEDLKGVYRVLELDTMEPVKREKEKFIRCLEID